MNKLKLVEGWKQGVFLTARQKKKMFIYFTVNIKAGFTSAL